MLYKVSLNIIRINSVGLSNIVCFICFIARLLIYIYGIRKITRLMYFPVKKKIFDKLADFEPEIKSNLKFYIIKA